MNLGFCPLASSSKGNSYLIKSDETTIVLDAGVSGRYIQDAFRFLNLRFRDIGGLLLTHEHIDHVRGTKKVLHVAEGCNVYCSRGTYEGLSETIKPAVENRVNLIQKGQKFSVGDIHITAFGISHDANEPLAYCFEKNGKKISIVTDTGIITDEITDAIADSDILVIESNHEVNILLYGRYPYPIKRRILSDVGHLSNETAGACILNFIKNLKEPKVPHVFLAHLSQENNTPQQAMLTIKNILEEEDIYVGKNLRLEVVAPEEVNDFVII